ncbi:U-box domain-containing protein 44-like isoform X2 [Phoenix dactylifera]|uniref:RING-type E3 ubiquitin transferase n=1 Tax=Phoenix dactylifera TaxID=42345 RepID=A0A8B7CU02_PHODC|nr:U-box domain-containing protein 44-like isoform X2 [Phoenix dactylifera]
MATTDLITNASIVPISEVISQIVEAVFETIHAARDVLLERQSFGEVSSYLERMVPLLHEMARSSRSRAEHSAALATAIDILVREVKAAKTLTLDCCNRSKLYLLLNCRRIVHRLESTTKEISRALSLLPLASLDLSSAVADDVGRLTEAMARAEFRAAVSEEEIIDKIEAAIQERNSDRSYANRLLSLIAEAVGISNDRSEIKKEFDEFKNEVAEAKLRKDIAEAIQMDQILALLGRADAASSFKEKEVKYYNKRNSLGSQPLEPLQSFYCPITRDVMEDPVETSSGQTFERRAIEKWFTDGNTNCPLTMIPLNTEVLRPNITLRKSIEEWKERNTIIIISSIKSRLSSGDEKEVLESLNQLQQLCEEKESNRECIVLENYLPILVGFLRGSNSMIKNRALSILCLLAKDNDDQKEKIAEVDNAIESIVKSLARRVEECKLAVALLLELSKSNKVRSYIGKVQGCILLLVTTSNSDNNQAASNARELLENLSFLDDNVVQMARANYFKPLLERLHSDDVKKNMVKTLAEMELTDHSKATLFEDGALEPLLQLMSHSDVYNKTMAVKALHKLSSFHQNGLQMIRARAVHPLLDLLHLHIGSSPSLRELVAATIMNIAISARELRPEETLDFLESDDEISRLFSLIILTGPKIQQSILQTFYALCQLQLAGDMRAKLRQFSAIQILIPHCENSDPMVRANAVKLLHCLMEGGDENMSAEQVGQRWLETLLSIIRDSRDEEEVAAALGIITNLPTGCTQITQWLLDAEALPIIVRYLTDGKLSGQSQLIENAVGALCRFTISSNLECQKRAAEAGVIPLLVQLLGSGTALTKRYAAISLAQFSESSLGLSRPVERRGGFLCCSAPPEIGCPVHMGVCSVEGSFCLVEADAVRPLVRVLGEQDPSASDAALRALSTLMEAERLQSGSMVLSQMNGVLPIIKLLSSQSSELQEKALLVLERIFRLEEYKRMYGASAQMPLVDITQRGNGSTKALAARILAHLNVLHDQSSYF